MIYPNDGYKMHGWNFTKIYKDQERVGVSITYRKHKNVFMLVQLKYVYMRVHASN